MKKLPKEITDKIEEVKDLNINKQYEAILNEVQTWKEHHPVEHYEVD